MKLIPALLDFRRPGVLTILGYSVLALAGCGGSGGPAPDTTPPTVPANLVATATSSTQINLTWTASTDDVAVTGYKVERCQGASCISFAQIAAPSGTTFNDTGLSAATAYSYRVRAADAAGNISAPSAVARATTAPDTTPPTVPANLVATAASSTQINLTWTASTDDVAVTGYKVERCQGASCISFAQIAAPSGTTFNDTGLSAATAYSYRVRAADAAGNVSTPSAVATATTLAASVAVSLSPKRGGLTVGQPLTLTASLTNDTRVTWSAPSGGSLAGQTNTTTSFSAAAAGVYTITATSVADSSKSATVSIGVTDLTGVFTYHNNISRDGANTKEFALTTANVTTSTFGKLFSCAVDGAVYAQPLWARNLTISGAKHNVIIVATQHDSIYAFDADTNANPCVLLWHFSLIDAAHGGTPGEGSVPSGATGGLVGSGFGDITAEVGITGTPVIDPSTNTLYVVSKSVNAANQFFQRLHALDLFTGNEKFGGPVSIDKTITVVGTGDGSSGGILAFDPQNQNQRPGLALANGMVYITWASHEDHSPYHGWVIAYNATTLARVAAFNTTPNGGLGGIWMSGAAPAFDNSGNAYFATGNGTFIIGDEYGDSIVKLGPPAAGTFPVLDYFTPFNQNSLNGSDGDLGSGGVLLLPDLPSGSPHQHLLVQVGKEGKVYLVDRNTGQMGQYCNGCVSDNVVQELPGAVNGMWGTPAYWNGNIYTGGAQDGASGDTMKAFSFNSGGSGLISTSPTSVSSHTFNFSGPTPSVSANGTSNGIVWALDNSQYGPPRQAAAAPAVLHAYDATNLATELWNSSQAPGGRDTAGFAVKFTVPTIANGKVYIGTRGNDSTQGSPTIKGEIDVYGLLPN